eukprot:365904-Chlamydomonas_euryale.AAC.8
MARRGGLPVLPLPARTGRLGALHSGCEPDTRTARTAASWWQRNGGTVVRLAHTAVRLTGRRVHGNGEARQKLRL